MTKIKTLYVIEDPAKNGRGVSMGPFCKRHAQQELDNYPGMVIEKLCDDPNDLTPADYCEYCQDENYEKDMP